MDTVTNRVISRTAQLRRARGFSQEVFAQRVREIGVPMTRHVLANIEADRREGLTIAEAVAFAEALGVELSELVNPEPFSTTIAVA